MYKKIKKLVKLVYKHHNKIRDYQLISRTGIIELKISYKREYNGSLEETWIYKEMGYSRFRDVYYSIKRTLEELR